MRLGHVIRIRPHHFLGILSIFGSEGKLKFEPTPPYTHAQHIVAEKVLNNRQITLELVLEVDEICEPCIYNKDEKCADVINEKGFETISKNEWNKIVDSRLFERLRLKEGTRIKASEFCHVLRKRIGNMSDIYRHIPPELIWEQYLMRGISNYLRENV